jgi:hypothetical protein
MPRLKMLAIAFACALAAPEGVRADGLITMEPGPVDFSGAIGGHAAGDGRLLQMIVPGSHPWFVNDDFPPSSYRIGCDSPYVLARTTAGQPGTPTESRVCLIKEAPVVGVDFITTLGKIGYQYALAYPFHNAGSGRALILWSDGGAERGMAPAHQGVARITGVGWRDQFAPAVRCDDAGDGGCVWRYFDHGDAFGAFINRFPSPDQEAAARIFQQIGVDGTGKVVAGASIVIDDWLLGEPATASGVQVSTVKPAVATRYRGDEIPFDSQSLCLQPIKDGGPRSPAWTQNCLASASEK